MRDSRILSKSKPKERVGGVKDARAPCGCLLAHSVPGCIFALTRTGGPGRGHQTWVKGESFWRSFLVQMLSSSWDSQESPGLLTGCDGGIMVSGGHTVLSRIPQQCFDPGRHPVCPRELRATLGCAGHTMANTMRSSPYTCQIPGVMVALHNGLAGDIDVPASA